MDQVIGNWKPYKGGKPPTPAPLGRGPKAGYENPRFPTIGPKDVKAPVGGYQSIISTAAPLDAGQERKIANVQRPFSTYSTSSGDRSRAAFAQGVADTTENTLKKATDTYQTDYRKQAEKSRSEDILAQRQNALDRYRQDVFRDLFDEDTRTRFSEGVKDMSQSFETVKRDEQAKRTAMILSFIGSMI